jgi:hypothetical protein
VKQKMTEVIKYIDRGHFLMYIEIKSARKPGQQVSMFRPADALYGGYHYHLPEEQAYVYQGRTCKNT